MYKMYKMYRIFWSATKHCPSASRSLLAKVLRQHLGESDSHLKSARRSKEALVDSR